MTRRARALEPSSEKSNSQHRHMIVRCGRGKTASSSHSWAGCNASREIRGDRKEVQKQHVSLKRRM
eukprot:579995-Amphidinium_carterae.1